MPSKNKSSKSKKSVKKVQPVVEPVVEPEPVVVEPVVDTPSESSVESVEEFDYTSEFTTLREGLRDAVTLVKSLTTQLNALEKRATRDRKMVQKRLSKKPRRVSNGLNGFSKPGPVSDDLRAFLKLGKQDLIARTEVTKRITAYCQEHKLQKKEDRRIIVPDKHLTKLLNVPKGENLTYFNLQKYMKVHFPNKEGVYPTL